MEKIISGISIAIGAFSGIVTIIQWFIPGISLYWKINITILFICFVLLIAIVLLSMKLKKLRKLSAEFKNKLQIAEKNRKGLEQNIQEYQHSDNILRDILQQIDILFYVDNLVNSDEKILRIYEYIQKLKNRL